MMWHPGTLVRIAGYLLSLPSPHSLHIQNGCQRDLPRPVQRCSTEVKSHLQAGELIHSTQHTCFRCSDCPSIINSPPPRLFSSPVFRAMLGGGFQEGSSELVVVRIDDVPPEAFAVFLGFMCHDRLALADLQVSHLKTLLSTRHIFNSFLHGCALVFHSQCPCIVTSTGSFSMAPSLRAQVHGRIPPSYSGCTDDS